MSENRLAVSVLYGLDWTGQAKGHAMFVFTLIVGNFPLLIKIDRISNIKMKS